MKNRKIKFKRWLLKIQRPRGHSFSRHNFLRLDKNERVDPFSKTEIKQITKSLTSNLLQSYPETETIYAQLARHYRLPRTSFVVTAGSDAAIRLAFEAFVTPRSEVIRWEPTFAMLDVYGKIFQAKQKKVSAEPNTFNRPEKILRLINDKTSLIYLANPNSPTGTTFSYDSLQHILQVAQTKGVPVFIDEAYFGFFTSSVIPSVKKHKNLIVSRTFSKSEGLAGLRIGFLVADPFLAQLLYRLRPMYEISSVAVEGARFALNHPKIGNRYIQEVNESKNLLKKFAKRHNLFFVDSPANFVHMGFRKSKSRAIQFLKKKGVLCRPGIGPKPLKDLVRISVGSKHTTFILIKKIADMLVTKSE